MIKNLKLEIIEKSYQLFKENGFDNVTLNQICEACNITKTTFYRYLSSKEEILTYFLSSINDELSELAVELINTNSHFEQIISCFNLVFSKMDLLGKELYSQLYITNLKKYCGSFDEINNFKRLVTNIIINGQKNNQFDNKEDPNKLYEIASTIMFGCGIKWCLGLLENPKEHLVISLQELLIVKNDFKLIK